MTHKLLKADENRNTNNLPDQIKNWDIRSTNPDSINPELHPNAQYSTLNVFAAIAITEYAKKEKSKIALIDTGSNQYSAEMLLPSGEYMVTSLNQAGVFKAGIFTPTGMSKPLPAFGDKSNKTDISPIMSMILVRAVKLSAKASNALKRVCDEYDSLGVFLENEIRFISDTIEGMLENENIKVNITGGEVTLLTMQNIERGDYNGTVMTGQPKILNKGKSNPSLVGKSIPLKEFKEMFKEVAKSNEGRWTDEEEMLIPSFPDDYLVPADAVEIAGKYVASHSDRVPILNFMWRGATSLGKSTGVKLICNAMHIPYVSITCHPDILTQDFLTQYVPCGNDDIVPLNEIPTLEDMIIDPQGAYKKLTKKDNDVVSGQMVLEALVNAVIEATKANNGQLFKLVPSAFVKACERGYVCEIQEPSRIKSPGVLVGINEFDRPGAVIPLVNGGYVTRHKDTMIIYTDNVGFASCRPMDPSVTRRAPYKIDNDELPRKEALDRVVYNTGFDKSELPLLNKMYDAWLKISEYCIAKDYTEGSISLSEFETWAQCVKIDGYKNVRRNCERTVIGGISPDREIQSDIKTQILVTLSED